MSRGRCAPHDYRRTSPEQVVVRTLESTPARGTRCSTRRWPSHRYSPCHSRLCKLLACSRIAARASNFLRIRCWCRNCADIVVLYIHPPEHAVVLCVDENSQIQALDRTAPLLPMRLGNPNGTRTYERPWHHARCFRARRQERQSELATA